MNRDDIKKASIRDILNRLKKLEGVSNDVELATPLHVSMRNIANWKARNSIPYEYINDYCQRNKYSLDYLINGIGSPRAGAAIAEQHGIYVMNTDQDVVYDIAAQVYAELLAQGKRPDKDKYRQLVKLLHRGMIETGAPPTRDKITEMAGLI